MAFNQFLEATLQDGTLRVQGKTQTGVVGGMRELSIYVGRIADDGTLPQLGDDLLQDHLGLRQLESPWTATYEQVPPSYAKGKPVILIGVASGNLPGGSTEVWYERAKIK